MSSIGSRMEDYPHDREDDILRIMMDLPFVDLRPFSEQGLAGKLTRPAWPMPEVGYEFVRQFGQVKRYPSKLSLPWPGEQYYCEASRLIVFDRSMREMIQNPKIHQISRRLFTDGIVGRAEIEFRSNFHSNNQYLAKQVASVKVRVGKAKAQPLIASGRRIAAEYAAATLPVALRENEEPPVPNLVLPGTPMVVIARCDTSGPTEYGDADIDWTMDHQWSYVGDSEAALWTIAYQPVVKKEDVEYAWRHAVRLHSEIEAFAAVLRACRRGLIDPQSKALNEYLYYAARRLLRNTYDKWPQRDILRSIALNRYQDREAELASLEQVFDNVKPGMLHMLKDASALYDNTSQISNTLIINAKSENGATVMVVDKSINIGSGVTVNGLVGSDNSFFNSSVGNVSGGDIHALVNLMNGQLREVESKLSGNETDYGLLVENQIAIQPMPAAKIEGYLNRILSGVQKIGEAGVPVAKTIGEILQIVGS